MLANKQKLFKKPHRKYFEFLILRDTFINPNQYKFQQGCTLCFQKLKARQFLQIILKLSRYMIEEKYTRVDKSFF